MADLAGTIEQAAAQVAAAAAPPTAELLKANLDAIAPLIAATRRGERHD